MCSAAGWNPDTDKLSAFASKLENSDSNSVLWGSELLTAIMEVMTN